MHPQLNAPMNASQVIPNESNGAKRKLKVRRSNQACGNESNVVISDHVAHSAREVCDSETSMGPDFVSTKEGPYCDMCTHTLYDVCSGNATSGYFHMNSQTLRSGINLHSRGVDGRLIGQCITSYVPGKSYDRVMHWT